MAIGPSVIAETRSKGWRNNRRVLRRVVDPPCGKAPSAMVRFIWVSNIPIGSLDEPLALHLHDAALHDRPNIMPTGSLYGQTVATVLTAGGVLATQRSHSSGSPRGLTTIVSSQPHDPAVALHAKPQPKAGSPRSAACPHKQQSRKCATSAN